MSYKIINPHNEKLRIQHEGTIYECPANGERPNTPEATAIFWKKHVHQFITIVDEGDIYEVEESNEEVTEETPEEILNDVIEEVSEAVEVTTEDIGEEIVEEPKTKKSNKKSKK